MRPITGTRSAMNVLPRGVEYVLHIPGLCCSSVRVFVVFVLEQGLVRAAVGEDQEKQIQPEQEVALQNKSTKSELAFKDVLAQLPCALYLAVSYLIYIHAYER